MKKTILALAAAAAFCAPALSQENGPADPRAEEMRSKLNSMRVSVDFNGVSLDEALNFLRDFSGLNMVLDAEVRSKLTEDQLKVTLKVKDLPLKSIIKLMLDPRDLTAVMKEGALLITSKERSDPLTLQIYDVRDLLLKIQDFPGPKVELTSPSGPGQQDMGVIVTLVEPRQILTPEFIVDMVKSNTGGRSWDDNPNARVDLVNGVLVVSQSRRVQREIRLLIDKLRQFK